MKHLLGTSCWRRKNDTFALGCCGNLSILEFQCGVCVVSVRGSQERTTWQGYALVAPSEVRDGWRLWDELFCSPTSVKDPCPGQVALGSLASTAPALQASHSATFGSLYYRSCWRVKIDHCRLSFRKVFQNFIAFDELTCQKMSERKFNTISLV